MPTAQDEQIVAPAAENVPARQSAHLAAPVDEMGFPAGHSVHPTEAEPEYLPTALIEIERRDREC